MFFLKTAINVFWQTRLSMQQILFDKHIFMIRSTRDLKCLNEDICREQCFPLLFHHAPMHNFFLEFCCKCLLKVKWFEKYLNSTLNQKSNLNGHSPVSHDISLHNAHSKEDHFLVWFGGGFSDCKSSVRPISDSVAAHLTRKRSLQSGHSRLCH